MDILAIAWLGVVILYIGFKPRLEGMLFRKAAIENNPDNVHLGNMGYHLSLGDEEKASEELRKHLKFNINEKLKEKENNG